MAAHGGFFAELKRRNVIRMAGLYVAAGWLVVEVAGTVLPMFEAPEWIARSLVIVIAIGFIPAVLFAWVFEVTPEGLKREDEIPAETSITHHTARRMDIALIAVVLLLVGYIAVDKLVLVPRRDAGMLAAAETSPAGKNTTVPGKSIAVLPFENLSNDKDNEYFVAGMQDMILTRLADVGGLKVISRSSTQKYKSRPDNLKQVAAELGVATLLEGSVQKAGNQVLINVQLIDAATDHHLWAQAYTRTLDNVFGVEGEVAQKIAEALKTQLSPAEVARVSDKPTRDPVAYDLFLRAEYLANKGQVNYDTAISKSAIALYQQAVAADPNFALAWARMSFVQSSLDWFGGGGLDQAKLKADARANAKRAAQLQPDLADAHLAVGFSDYWGRGDYAAALKAFEAARKARPNDAGAMVATAYVLRRQAHFDAAIAQLQAAMERDPRNTSYAFELGLTEMLAGRYAEAGRMFQRALALDPDNVQARLQYSTLIMLSAGDIPRALAQAQGDDPQLQLQRVVLLTYQRNYRTAITLLEGIPDTPDNFYFISGPKAYQLANLYWLAGDSARAKALFGQAKPWLRDQFVAQADSPINLAYIWSIRARVQLGLGQTDAALDSIARSQALQQQSGDHAYGPAVMQFNAVLYAEAGRADLAVPVLETFFAAPGAPGFYSPLMLWMDPAWDPIRKDPRFQALQRKYAGQAPVGGTATATIAGQ